MICQSDVYLMVDETLVASEQNTSLVREEAYKHKGNPVIDESHVELFGNHRGYRIYPICICRDQGRYRMWYHYSLSEGSHGQLSYAESDDGLNFQPVNVRQGSNHVAVVSDPNLACSWILHDPLDTDDPYKAVIIRKGGGEMNRALRAKYPQANGAWHGHTHDGWFVWGIARSRDGFNWRLPRHRHNLVDAIIEEPSLYRALDGGLVISNQMVSKVSDIGWRKVNGWVTYDGRTSDRIPDFIFSLPDHMTMVFPQFLGRSAWATTPWAQSHVQLAPAIKGPTMVALHGYIYGAIGTETHAQVAEIGLAASSTGYRFDQVWPFRPFLRRGNMGEWDCGLVRQVAIIDDADQTRFYYQASDVGNAANTPYRLGIGHVALDRYGYRVLRVYRDYLQPKSRRGHVVLQPLTLPKKPSFSLNVTHVTPHRTVRVELRDTETAKPIPGFEMDQCHPVTEPGVRQPVKWKKGDIAKLAKKQVSVAIELFSPDCQYGERDSPRLYAVYTA
jgi:hypothetical protein